MKRRFSGLCLFAALALVQGSQSSARATSQSLENEIIGVLVAVAPGYPPLALSSGVTGEVAVRVKVNAKGGVTSAKVIDGHRLLREGCKEAGLQWKFTPLQQEGERERIIELKFVFLIASRTTATARLTTVFKHPNKIEITRRIPQSLKLKP